MQRHFKADYTTVMDFRAYLTKPCCKYAVYTADDIDVCCLSAAFPLLSAFHFALTLLKSGVGMGPFSIAMNTP